MCYQDCLKASSTSAAQKYLEYFEFIYKDRRINHIVGNDPGKEENVLARDPRSSLGVFWFGCLVGWFWRVFFLSFNLVYSVLTAEVTHAS